MNELVATLQSWAAWIGERWATSDPPPLWVVALALAVIIATAAIRPLWHLTRNAITVVHEMGHVTIAWLMGRRIQGIRLHSDTSGLAITAGRPRGLGVLLTFLSGYTAPGVLGLAMVWASYAGFSGIALTVLLAVLILAFFLVRNVFGFVVVIVALALTGYAFWDGAPIALTATTFVVGTFLCIGGVRASLDLWRAHAKRDAGASDAAMAAEHSLLPAMAWVYFFIAFTSACAILAIILIGTATF